jgi:hypothetical protein
MAFLPGRDSRPLDYTTLPGRTRKLSTTPLIRKFPSKNCSFQPVIVKNSEKVNHLFISSGHTMGRSPPLINGSPWPSIPSRPTSVKKSADPLSDQPGDFSIIGKSLILSILHRIDQFAVTFYIKDTATAFD